VAVKLPKHAGSLFVPSAICVEGIPTIISAGIVTTPPPPAIASMNPPNNAAEKRKA
jgi:hypothetical protein